MSARVRRVGGGGQRQPRHVAMLVEQRPQQPIVGAEVVPPFADAMRLVDREQGNVRFLQQLRKAFGRRPLGRDVEQVELPVAQRVADCARVLAGAGQRGGADAERFRPLRTWSCISAISGRNDDRRSRAGPAPGAGSTATCPPRSASPRACDAPPWRARRPVPARRGSGKSRTGHGEADAGSVTAAPIAVAGPTRKLGDESATCQRLVQ